MSGDPDPWAEPDQAAAPAYVPTQDEYDAAVRDWQAARVVFDQMRELYLQANRRLNDTATVVASLEAHPGIPRWSHDKTACRVCLR